MTLLLTTYLTFMSGNLSPFSAPSLTFVPLLNKQSALLSKQLATQTDMELKE